MGHGFRGPRAGWGARVRRQLGEDPRNNGDGDGVIRPNALQLPVIALSGGAARVRAAGARVSASPRRHNARFGGVQR